MDSEIDVCTEKKTLIVIVVALLILSFWLGYALAERTPYCHITNKDVDDIWGEVGFGDLRFLSEDMTLKQVKEQYDFYYPISKYITVSFLSGVCK